jgi:hypothetical protein
MKKILFLLTMASLILASAAPASAAGAVNTKNQKQTHLFTIINKTGLPLGVRLISTDADHTVDHNFYLTVVKGTDEIPTEKTFELPGDTYAVSANYVQFYDPVYGWGCTTTKTNPGTMTLDRNIRMTFMGCKARVSFRGRQQEVNQRKFGVPKRTFNYRYVSP